MVEGFPSCISTLYCARSVGFSFNDSIHTCVQHLSYVGESYDCGLVGMDLFCELVLSRSWEVKPLQRFTIVWVICCGDVPGSIGGSWSYKSSISCEHLLYTLDAATAGCSTFCMPFAPCVGLAHGRLSCIACTKADTILCMKCKTCAPTSKFVRPLLLSRVSKGELAVSNVGQELHPSKL